VPVVCTPTPSCQNPNAGSLSPTYHPSRRGGRFKKGVYLFSLLLYHFCRISFHLFLLCPVSQRHLTPTTQQVTVQTSKQWRPSKSTWRLPSTPTSLHLRSQVPPPVAILPLNVLPRRTLSSTTVFRLTLLNGNPGQEMQPPARTTRRWSRHPQHRRAWT
jgi:hypothetical protein